MINFDRIFLSKFGKKLNKTLNKNMNSKLPSDYKSVLDINSRKRYKISPDSYLNNSGLEIDIKQSLSQRIEEAKIENFIKQLSRTPKEIKEQQRDYISKLRGFQNYKEEISKKLQQKVKAEKILKYKKNLDKYEFNKFCLDYKYLFNSTKNYYLNELKKNQEIEFETKKKKIKFSHNIRKDLLDKIINSKNNISIEKTKSNSDIFMKNETVGKKQIQINKNKRKTPNYKNKENIENKENIDISNHFQLQNISYNKEKNKYKNIINKNLSFCEITKKTKKYHKKWNSMNNLVPFGKISGRIDLKRYINENKIYRRTKYYSSNYSSIKKDTSKTFVHYGNNSNEELHNLKIRSTRKLIYNLNYILNSSDSTNYNVIDIIKKEKEKKNLKKLQKLKDIFGQYYILFDQNNINNEKISPKGDKFKIKI